MKVLQVPFFEIPRVPDNWLVRSNWPKENGVYRCGNESYALYAVTDNSVSFWPSDFLTITTIKDRADVENLMTQDFVLRAIAAANGHKL